MPAGHATQPVPFTKYVPARQLDGLGIVEPGLHTYPTAHGPLQFAIVRPDTEPYRPAAHGPLHVEFTRPVVLPYCPAGHGLQPPAPATEYWPAAQITLVLFHEPAGQ